MNNKSEPTMDGDSLEDFTGSFSSVHAGDSVEKLKPGETLNFLAVFIFLVDSTSSSIKTCSTF